MNCPSCNAPCDGTEKFCKSCGSPVPTAPTGDDPLIGQILGGKFRVVKMLGEGGMGCVYEGEQQLGTKTRRVAIKTLHKHLSSDPSILARFQRECGTLSELEHPNTIQVYDFGTTPPGDGGPQDAGQLYIVMEFVQGKSLADVLLQGPLEPRRAENILRQVCGSLEEAHQRGIIHRDLKPDNIVLTERAGQQDFVKVLDFGIAKNAAEEASGGAKLTQAGMVLGTPPYMSPEQFTGKPIDARSDIYALGVMAFEMLTGKLPWTAESPGEWAVQHMTVQPYPLEQMPEAAKASPAMKAAIMKAMAKSPDDRPKSVKEFFDAMSSGAPPPSRVTVHTDPGVVSQRGATLAQPAFTPPVGIAGGAPPAMAATPGAAPAFVPGGPPPGRAAASSGGGGGKTFTIVGVIAVVLVGGGLAAFFGMRKPAGASTGSDAGAIAATVTDAEASDDGGGTGSEPLEGLDIDAGKKPAHPTFDGGGRVAMPDAGKTVTVVDAGGGSKHYVPACGYAEQMRKLGKKAECMTLAQQCAAAGNTMPSCN